MDLIRFLPEQSGDWTAKKTVPLKNSSDLYAYMDGGAELYISYFFKEALSRTYSNGISPDVVAEIYDLNTPREAFGVFTQSREDEIQKYGQCTYMIPGAIIFWKDHYYISLSSWDVTRECNEFMHHLASFVDQSISANGELPAVVKLLPQEGLTKAGYKYFHHPVWINSYFYISDRNIFGIDNTSDAVIAKYSDTIDSRRYLLLVRYENEAKATDAFDFFASEFFPGGLDAGCTMLSDGTWLAAARQGSLLVSVFNASGRESALMLLNNVLQISQQRNP